MSEPTNVKYVVKNRRARHDYEIRETLEVGIALQGSEVKSLREGKVQLSDAYAQIEKGEVILKNLHISPYKMASENHDPIRPRRLLLHRKEIRKLVILTEQRGLTLIPLSIYFRKNIAKVELAVAMGRKKYDKRQAIAEAEADRSIKRAMRKDY